MQVAVAVVVITVDLAELAAEELAQIVAHLEPQEQQTQDLAVVVVTNLHDGLATAALAL